MEIESKNGFKTRIHENLDFGRGLGFNSTDPTVSRRHISFKLHEDRSKVYFEVKGKNPVWVHHRTNDEIRVYKRSEGGEMKTGDSFCVSSKNPNWFNLKEIASEDDAKSFRFDDDDALAETSGSAINYDEIDTGDVSDIDPVKEFNFVVMGHEFDCYPKKMIRDIRDWDWFLEEPNEKSDDDEDDDDSKRKVKKGTRKRKKGRGKEDDDDVWTGESEEDAEMIKKLKNVPKPKYSTRSKNQKKNKKGATVSKSTKNAKDEEEEEEEEEDDDDDDDDDDETLGGFVVDDGEETGEEGDDEEVEEEFEEDEYDDE